MELKFQVNKPLDLVFEYLSDSQKLVKIHPTIEQIEPLTGNFYKIFEKSTVGFFPYSFTYLASIIPEKSENRVVIYVKVLNLINVCLFFGLESQGKGTVVRETVSFPNFFVSFLVRGIVKEQQEKLFENLNTI